MIRRRCISTRILEPGMIIDQSIIDHTGRILINRKTRLNEYMIAALQKMGIGSIYIREGEESEEELTYNISPEIMEKIEQVKVPNVAKVQLKESVKNAFRKVCSFCITTRPTQLL